MKRNSNKQLNHDNWDDEETPEERGKFAVADGETIAKRKVLSVKRKQTTSNPGVFKSFGGFNTQIPLQSFNITKVDNVVDNREKHVTNLRQLNLTFFESIKKNIEENDCCIFTPLFDDYNKFLLSIKSKYPLNNIESSATVEMKTNSDNVKEETVPKAVSSIFNFGLNSSELKSFGNAQSNVFPGFSSDKSIGSSSTNMPTTLGGMFQLKPENKPFGSSMFDTKSKEDSKQEVKSFGSFPAFGESKTNEGASNMFTNTSLPFKNEAESQIKPLFGATTFQFKPQETVANEDDEEYVPPKAESREIKESDSVFDIRCKLFYLNGKDWKEKGVGNIFVKPLSEGKCQLVMRADNTLGTILLNTLVTKVMPMSINKNNVNLVTMTDFAGEDLQSTSLLFRVKSAENAQQLLEAIKGQVE